MHANVLEVFLNCNISMYKAGYAHYQYSSIVSTSHYRLIESAVQCTTAAASNLNTCIKLVCQSGEEDLAFTV
jgi:hypothetical protein